MAREKQPLSLILCDVDFFKTYNDTFGHLQGDRCLQEVAHTLKYTLHRPGDMVARYGGEEFVIRVCRIKAKPYSLKGYTHIRDRKKDKLCRPDSALQNVV